MAKRIAALLLVMSLMLAFYAVASTYGYGSNNTISPEDIKFGQTDQELGGIWISQIQFRLNDYGYFEGENFNPGELDSATGRALQRYCSVIGVNLDSENMLTRGLQSRILSSSALPKWPPEVTPEPSTAPTPFPVFTIGASDLAYTSHIL